MIQSESASRLRTETGSKRVVVKASDSAVGSIEMLDCLGKTHAVNYFVAPRLPPRSFDNLYTALYFTRIRVANRLAARSSENGEVTERPKVRHWKCRVRVKLHRGFESHPLRL